MTAHEYDDDDQITQEVTGTLRYLARDYEHLQKINSPALDYLPATMQDYLARIVLWVQQGVI